MIEMRGGVSLVFRICTVPLPNNAALQAEWARVEIRKRQFWSTSVQLVFDAARAEGFEFLRVRETATKGSSFWRRSTKRRRVRLFARERDGDQGFEFSEPKIRLKISDLSGAR